MCKFNVMCQANDGTCTCSNHSLLVPKVVHPVYPSPPTDTALLYHLFALVSQQHEITRTLSEQTNVALKRVETLTQYLEAGASKPSSSVIIPREEVTTSEHINALLCGSKSSYLYSLRLISDLPSPAYKERAFSMMLEIINSNNEKITMPIPVNFKILLFTTESPPKRLKANTSGDKIMRGSIEAESNGVVLFKKIVIKEVTSHFRNGCVFLVVIPKNSTEIKPFIIPNFIIKARKILSIEPSKKQKTSEKQVE